MPSRTLAPSSETDLSALNDSPLGKTTDFPERLSPDVLFAIDREGQREPLGIRRPLPFHGTDLWTAWELTWLTPSGKPSIAALRLAVPAESPSMIESKSLKLYLNSFAMETFADDDAVVQRIRDDLSARIGADVAATLHRDAPIATLPGRSLDRLDTECRRYVVDPATLAADPERDVEETWHSTLLRSLCPVTSQPDFGSIVIRYAGPQIDPAGLLQYIVSFRAHQDFHEACVERMFTEIAARCRTRQLTVYASYQRRGGIDINPFRSDFEATPVGARYWNQ